MKTKTALCLTILVMLVCAMNMAMVWQLTHIKPANKKSSSKAGLTKENVAGSR